MKSAQYWIDQLGLARHPEGGYFASAYRSDEWLAAEALPSRYDGRRQMGSSIYFLVTTEHFSAFHRLRTDEIWHFYTGSCLTLHLLHPDGSYEKKPLGPAFEAGERFQHVVKAGAWFAAEVAAPDAYALVGCTLAPGFDFADFELAQREVLTAQHPLHADRIASLTRS